MRCAAGGLLLGALAACAPRVPVPPRAQHAGDEPVVVPYPPPAARPEVLPPRPSLTALWIDGQWEWTGATYAWTAGRWQEPPAAGACYAPATSVRRRNGQLVYYTGSWHESDGRPLVGTAPR